MQSIERIQNPTLQSKVITPSQDVVVYHCVQGLATIKMVNPPQSAADDLVHQFGPSWGAPSDQPDIEVTFTTNFPSSPQLRFIGRNQAAFDAENFYILDSDGKKTQIDFGCIGEPCKLVCEQGVKSTPFLLPILALRLLCQGHVLLHSSAFIYGGLGILVTGWQKGGKTEMLLPFMDAGADYLSDEWTIVSSQDSTMRGLLSIVQVWSWHFRFLPQYWRRIDRKDRRRIQLVRLYQRIYQSLPTMVRRNLRPQRILAELNAEGGNASLGQARTSPRVLFRENIWEGPANVDRIFLATVGEGSTRVVRVDPQKVADRMIASLSFERRAFLIAYDQFRFAFPERTNRVIETARQEELRLLSQAFAGKPTYEICHPYPVPLIELYNAALPFCR